MDAVGAKVGVGSGVSVAVGGGKGVAVEVGGRGVAGTGLAVAVGITDDVAVGPGVDGSSASEHAAPTVSSAASTTTNPNLALFCTRRYCIGKPVS